VPRAFDDRAHSVGAILAAHAAIALNASLNQDKARNLDRALATSREIGMAVGILMAHRRCGEDDAFLALRNASNRLNLKLREVAARVVKAGEIIDEPTRPRRAERAGPPPLGRHHPR
jgi:AmiR/NasT family two-component response regulator